MSDTPQTDQAEASALEVGQWHLAKQCRQLERENAELREDKARLDWLDANCEVIVSTAVKGYDLFGHNAHLNTNHLGNLRLAIDAARKEAQP